MWFQPFSTKIPTENTHLSFILESFFRPGQSRYLQFFATFPAQKMVSYFGGNFFPSHEDVNSLFSRFFPFSPTRFCQSGMRFSQINILVQKYTTNLKNFHWSRRLTKKGRKLYSSQFKIENCSRLPSLKGGRRLHKISIFTHINISGKNVQLICDTLREIMPKIGNLNFTKRDQM